MHLPEPPHVSALLALMLASPVLMAPGFNPCPACLLVGRLQPDEIRTYHFEVSQGLLYQVLLHTHQGDTDLYLAEFDGVSFEEWDCRPYLDGSQDEICTVEPSRKGPFSRAPSRRTSSASATSPLS